MRQLSALFVASASFLSPFVETAQSSDSTQSGMIELIARYTVQNEAEEQKKKDRDVEARAKLDKAMVPWLAAVQDVIDVLGPGIDRNGKYVNMRLEHDDVSWVGSDLQIGLADAYNDQANPFAKSTPGLTVHFSMSYVGDRPSLTYYTVNELPYPQEVLWGWGQSPIPEGEIALVHNFSRHISTDTPESLEYFKRILARWVVNNLDHPQIDAAVAEQTSLHEMPPVGNWVTEAPIKPMRVLIGEAGWRKVLAPLAEQKRIAAREKLNDNPQFIAAQSAAAPYLRVAREVEALGRDVDGRHVIVTEGWTEHASQPSYRHPIPTEYSIRVQLQNPKSEWVPPHLNQGMVLTFRGDGSQQMPILKEGLPFPNSPIKMSYRFGETTRKWPPNNTPATLEQWTGALANFVSEMMPNNFQVQKAVAEARARSAR